MAYVSVPESSFERGIDVRSSENQIPEGFVRDLLNADVVEKRVRKRPGYQGFAGNLPIRVTKLEYHEPENEVCFTLDSSISLDSEVNLDSVRSSPLVVYGRSSNIAPGNGPFNNTTDILKYYPGFTVPLRKELLAPSGTLTIPGSEHGLGTTDMFVGIVQADSVIDRSFTQIYPDSIIIDESTYDISIDYTVFQDTTVFVYFLDRSVGGGEAFVQTALAVPVGTTTISIPTATHNLSNFNIIVRVQRDTGASVEEVLPEEVVIDPAGNVDVTFVNGTGSAQDYTIILSAAPIANVVSGNVSSNSTNTITISDPEKPWIYMGIYLEDGAGDLHEVVPDSVVFDDVADTITTTFVNGMPIAAKFVIYYQFGDLRSNQLCVEDTSVTSDQSDDRPQLTIWGLDQTEIYGAGKSSREGWVTHIDSYRRSGEQRIVSGLGGNLYSARTYSEAATTYGYASLFPNLNTRTDSQLTIAPLFWETGELPERSRGYITADDSGLNICTVSAVEYDSGNGWTKYTLELPGKLILDSTGTPTSLASVISTTAGLEDYLDVQSMSFSIHNGSFKIRQVVDGVDEIEVWVENDQVNSNDFDDDGVAGEAGVFTDQLVWTADSPYIPSDTLLSSALEQEEIYTVKSSQGDTTVVYGISARLEIAGGVTFLGERTSSVIPMRSEFPGGLASTTNLVRGDMLSYTGIARLLRVLQINPDSNRLVDISSDGSTATVTLQSGDTSFLSVGMRLVLTQSGVYDGVREITDIISATEYTFDADGETDSVSGGTQVGETTQIDEELTWADSSGDVNGFIVEERWIPIEAPDDSYNLTPSTYTRYLDTNSYGSQVFLRSTMLASNMYLTNGDDEVYKFDGSNLYRAGLIPWQPGAFLTQETTGATIVTDLRSVAYTAISAPEGKLEIASTDQQSLPIGSPVRLTGSTETYTIRDYFDDGTDFFILVDRSLDGSVAATGTISEIGVYRYYYRLNSVDVNDNLISSAVTGYQDHVVELTGNAAVQHKLVGLPAWDNYDFDRLELQIYRTKINQAAPFYLVTTLRMDFDNTQGYISFRDSFADSDLTQLDEVSTALKGAELGTAWSDPLRAKYVTSIGNRLVLGNVRDYPQLDIQIVADGTVTNSTFAGDTLLFRRDNADTGTTTDNVNRIRFEWINGTTDAAGTYVIGTDDFSFDATNLPGTVAANDWIYLSYSTVATTGRNPYLAGWYQIADVTGTTVTVNFVGAVVASTYPDKYTIATDSRDVPVLLGVDGNLGMANGDSFDVFDSMRRMSMAVNASQRMVDITLTGMEEFVPWLVARGGNDLTPAGRLIVRQPRSDQNTFEIVPTFSGYDLFVNSIRRTSTEQIQASTRVYPSRILASYENYPEIIDNPTSVLDVDSDSAIDVNPADGQEITGIIPFFGETAFTAAQQAAVLVVFKTNSIYLVDLNQKALGNNPVQRIETEGLGCTAPYSIAATKSGIMFANTSGIYCLRRDQSIQYVGRFMERNWTERVDLSSLDLVQGHHYGLGRSYKCSIPLEDDVQDNGYIENSEVYVYNHTAEESGQLGAWSRYDNHPATGWANLLEDAYFATSNGRVFSLRRTGDVEDFRDDSSPIDFRIDTRALDFGSPGIRKVVDRSVVHYRTPSRNTGTTVSYSLDLETEFSASTSPIIPHGPALVTGVDDFVDHEIETIYTSTGRRRSVYFQLRIENDAIDESLEIAGIDFKVSGLSDKGILSAQDSRSK